MAFSLKGSVNRSETIDLETPIHNGIEAAYYSNVSNKSVRNQASNILTGEDKHIKKASYIIKQGAVTMLGHILREDNDNTIRKINDFRGARLAGASRRPERSVF